MSGWNLFELERTALSDLVQLVEYRVGAEQNGRATYEAAKLQANKDVTRARKTIGTEREQERSAVTGAWDEARRTIQQRFNDEQSAADRLRDFTIQETNDRAKSDEDKTQSAWSDAIWTADSLYEAAEKQANDQLNELNRKASAGGEAIETIWSRAAPFLRKGRLSRADFAQVTPPTTEPESPLDQMNNAIVQGERTFELLSNLKSLRWVGLRGWIECMIVFGLVGAIPVFLVKEDRLMLILGAVVLALLSGSGAYWLLHMRAMRRSHELAMQLAAALNVAGVAGKELMRSAGEQHAQAIDVARQGRDSAKARAKERFPPLLTRIAERRQNEINAAEDKHEQDSERLRNWLRESLGKAEDHFAPALQQCHDRYDNELAEAEATFEKRKVETQDERERAWGELTTRWRDGQDRLIDTFNRLKAAEVEHFLPWNAPFWKNFHPAEKVPEGIRFGAIKVDLRELQGAVPEDEELALALPMRLDLPAFLPFPDRCSLVLRARDQGRAKAVEEMQTIMLRFLTSIPAGKVRFTIIDPVGLGDNFAAFMHLADFDENLIGSRIWTEPVQIEKRLSDITAHMENVIQKYLRNQYKNIEEYNAQAGEVAEPFRVLVVANFPANFSLEAARRLVSIVQSGATCGVYTLISIDAKQPLPQGFNVSDLEQGSLNLVWKNDAFQWKDPILEKFPLRLEEPPAPDEVVRLVRIAGERGRDANRVEVPFDFVMPKRDEFWTCETRKGLAVPIGRSGATKQQIFALGQGTAQHALIAGKTGSGKSTLLHALITNLALHYSPEQIELYLIDFKKGVEFKAYAENRLPHARVIAIESEREFGLSVLQRLDGVLRERGDRFRAAGVNDLLNYREFLAERNAAPDEGSNGQHVTDDHPATCPRILLIVDEFQEFFVEDDRIAQESALLLDRLVRQGRAFGLHVLLGSQTLGGAYTLARSTIDQMAVRIALQCSDADAQLILSKDNSAARLLSRPGEAIYNNANGLIEGNNVFQIVWLSDLKREQLLKKLRSTADDRADYPPPLVFEGNIAADMATNQPLNRLLNESSWPEQVKAASAWLGDAIAIKDPTAAVLRPNSGSNLLVIGQQEETALALFASCLIGLAAQHGPSARFCVLDGTTEDDLNAGFLGRVAGTLAHNVSFLDRTTMGEELGRIAAIVSARQTGEAAERDPIYLIVHGLHRFRDLRKPDDEFGFGRRGAERVVTPGEHFTNIIKDGPLQRVHVLVWCDVLTNLNRSIDRQLLREFGMRVLFQMNANDSSTLIDSPAASKLGRNRALFVTEEQAQPEKFRPYGLPTTEWLKHVKFRFARRKQSGAS
jgi:DNA segregation ATPase FtsK/SpoIIIE, S-DNA-T family